MTAPRSDEPRNGPAGDVEHELGFRDATGARLPVALFVSPHLDDVAFSCGGTLARLAANGWYTVVVTAFTKSVKDPAGFALACQTDKGLPPEVDYMALRREEDREFAARAGAGRVVWSDLPEAPHRGYGSAGALFSGIREGDEVWREVAGHLVGLVESWSPRLVFAPQGLGAHADHLQVIRAVLAGLEGQTIAWYRDTPYAYREPHAVPPPLLPSGFEEVSVDVGPYLETKLRAAAAYETQLGFQFGGEEAMREALASFAAREARRTGAAGAAETFLVRSGRAAGPPFAVAFGWRHPSEGFEE